MNFRFAAKLAASSFFFLALGCSKDKPTSSNNAGQQQFDRTEWNDQGYWDVLLDATSSDHFVYYSLASGDTVDISDSEAQGSTAWDVAFKRSVVVLNGGVSGPGEVSGVDMAALGHPDSTDFMAFDDLGSIGDSDWMSDSYSLMIHDWYMYDPQSHMLNLTHYVYIMMDAVGNYVKFQVISMQGNGMPPDMGTISIQYDYAGESPDFPGTPDTISFDGSGGGPVYIDFSAGTVTNPPDPMNSTDWDIAFEAYEVHQNCSVFGPGSAATYEVWMDQDDPTDFYETPSAPEEPNAYFPDDFGSVFSTWYEYSGPPLHRLTSYEHVYVIRNGANHYKMQILNYYQDIDGEPVSGYYTFRWVRLQ